MSEGMSEGMGPGTSAVARRRVAVLILADGATWEAGALRGLHRETDLVVVRRCLDLPDLLAQATTGEADVAVLDADLVDAPAVEHLRRHQVAVVAVTGDGPADDERLRTLGCLGVVSGDDLTAMPAAVRLAGRHSSEQQPVSADPDEDLPQAPAGFRGRVTAVWGPAGAPGTTTVATSVAAELAGRRRRCVLIDADPLGGSVAQHLGMLDEVSGLLLVARHAATGTLDEERFRSVRRQVSPGLQVVTGLPRADRWAEVPESSLHRALEMARSVGEVVVDTGFCLEDDSDRPGGGRHALTLTAVRHADEVLVVGTADAVGLARLARGLSELAEVRPSGVTRVVVNRMRASVGWREDEVCQLLRSYKPTLQVSFLPDDRTAADRALRSGRSIVECGESPLRRAVSRLVDDLDRARDQLPNRSVSPVSV